MAKKFYLEPFKKCAGSLCFTLLSLELPIIFDDNHKTTSVSLFTADFNLLSCEFDRFTFKLLYWIIFY